TSTCCPQLSVSLVAMMRARISVVPPGGNGVMRRTGRFGYACAYVSVPAADAPTNAPSITTTPIFVRMEALLPLSGVRKIVDTTPLTPHPFPEGRKERGALNGLSPIQWIVDRFHR